MNNGYYKVVVKDNHQFYDNMTGILLNTNQFFNPGEVVDADKTNHGDFWAYSTKKSEWLKLEFDMFRPARETDLVKINFNKDLKDLIVK